MDSLDEFDQKPLIALKRLRLLAALIDFLIYWTLSFVIGICFGEIYTDADGIGVHLKGFPAFVCVLAWFLIIPINEGINGQTFGKRLIKIKVVKINYQPTNILVSLIRHLFDFVDFFFLLGILIASINKQKRRIGDFVAGTIVIMKV